MHHRNDELAAAEKIGTLYGKRFALVVAVTLMSLREHTAAEKENALEALLAIDSFRDFAPPPITASKDVFTGNFQETERGSAWLRDIAERRRKNAADHDKQDSRTKAALIEIEDDEVDGGRVSDEAEGAMSESFKAPRMAKELKIDMAGWTPEELANQHNEHRGEEDRTSGEYQCACA